MHMETTTELSDLILFQLQLVPKFALTWEGGLLGSTAGNRSSSCLRKEQVAPTTTCLCGIHFAHQLCKSSAGLALVCPSYLLEWPSHQWKLLVSLPHILTASPLCSSQMLWCIPQGCLEMYVVLGPCIFWRVFVSRCSVCGQAEHSKMSSHVRGAGESGHSKSTLTQAQLRTAQREATVLRRNQTVNNVTTQTEGSSSRWSLQERHTQYYLRSEVGSWEQPQAISF